MTATPSPPSGEHEHPHDPHLAHHFEDRTQQHDAGKLGMWIFLSTEVLLFSGLFCAYAVYRANHPEIFIYAHQYLDTVLGGVNTLVLIFSSFTMAWAVRAAQLGKRTALVTLLAITLACAFGFLGIKVVEYEHKWKHGLLWGTQYRPQEPHQGSEPTGQPSAADAPAADARMGADEPAAGELQPGGPAQPRALPAPGAEERSLIEPAPQGPPGLAPDGVDTVLDMERHQGPPKNVQIFFGIYFAMTGLHGLHVLAGMAVLGWLLLRAWRGEFGPSYFTPVDLGGLYWHLVDLIWIYLFPLLYLIGPPGGH